VADEKAYRISGGVLRVQRRRIFAIALGLVEGDLAKRYAKEIAADDLPPTVTPYMSTFEVMALVKAGECEAAIKKFESVWGAMTDFGVDAYWEGWDIGDKGDERYIFYSRPFGKSLCHAWASGPAFLIPGVFLGIEPDGDGWLRTRVRPGVKDYAPDAKVRIPTGRQGVIEIDVGKGFVRKFIK
jgi:hypothetical protein